MILYGITSLQTYMYFIRYPKDPRWTKNIVSSLWMMDTFHIFLISHAIYHYLVLNYANPSSLESGIWSLFLSIGVNVAIAFLTQCFFIHRLHQLSGGKWWITGPILVSVLAHLCFGIETMIELFQKKDFDRLSEITYIAALPFAVLAVLSDILITVALCVLLHNSRTGFRSTNSMLNLIIVYAINRCLLTSVVAIIEMVMFVTAQETLWYLAADFVVGKLYANSLLATLNSRSALAGKGMEDEESTDSTNASFHIGSITQSIVLDKQLSPKRSISVKKAENEVVSSVSLVRGPSGSKGSGSGTKNSGSKGTVAESKQSGSRSAVAESKHDKSEGTTSNSKHSASNRARDESPQSNESGLLVPTVSSSSRSASRSETDREQVEVSIRSAVQSSSSGRSAAKASTVDKETHMIDV